MSGLPGWDSIAWTGWWSGFFFWASIGSLVLLGASEVVSHRYSERKDELVERQQAAEKRTHDDEIARLHLETAKANEAAEKLRQQNLALEQALSPRILEQTLAAQSLSRFAATPFVVLSPIDFEPRRTADQLRFMLLQAKWQRVDPSTVLTRPFSFFDGIVVHIWRGMGDQQLSDAADALVAILNKNGITARTGFPPLVLDENGKQLSPLASATTPGVLVVVVGPKPLPSSLQIRPADVPQDEKGGRTYGNFQQ